MNRGNARAVDSKILKGRRLPRSRVLHPERFHRSLTERFNTVSPRSVSIRRARCIPMRATRVRSSRSTSQRILPAFTRASEHEVTEADRISSLACHWITGYPLGTSTFISGCHTPVSSSTTSASTGRPEPRPRE